MVEASTAPCHSLWLLLREIAPVVSRAWGAGRDFPQEEGLYHLLIIIYHKFNKVANYDKKSPGSDPSDFFYSPRLSLRRIFHIKNEIIETRKQAAPNVSSRGHGARCVSGKGSVHGCTSALTAI